jgi:formylglycine-generating enzyme required for sulfatase activity
LKQFFRVMKVTHLIVLLHLSSVILHAQTAPALTPAAGSTNAAVAGAAASTNAPAAVAAASTNKIDIKELMKMDSFTNSTGMVLVKTSPMLWAGKYEVTQEEYQKVVGSNPSQFRGERNPVDSVSWNDALKFCDELTKVERKEEMLPEGFAYTLPTQAQWESLMNGAQLKDAVTSSGATRSGTAPVGSLGPNSLGLFDTRGNLWEWCLDPQDKPFRVLRGGGWETFVEVNLRPEFRWFSKGPDDQQNNYGFRCILVGAPGAKTDDQ